MAAFDAFDNSHQAWMRRALEQAREALPVDVPVGALVVSGGDVIASACNRRERDGNPIAHAEMLVLQEAASRLGDWRLKETTLYVTLEPCPMCASAIAQARVPTLVFGAYDPLLGACGSRSQALEPAATTVFGGILEAECAALLRGFFQECRG